MITGGLFAVYYRDLSVNPKNYKSPVSYLRSNKFFMTSPNAYKEGYILTKHVEVETDTGVIGETKASTHHVAYDHSFETFATIERTDKFFQMYFKVSPKGQTYSRRYVKLDFVLAEIEALICIYFVGMAILIAPFEKFYFYKNFINSIRRKSKVYEENSTNRALPMSQKAKDKFKGEPNQNVYGDEEEGGEKALKRKTVFTALDKKRHMERLRTLRGIVLGQTEAQNNEDPYSFNPWPNATKNNGDAANSVNNIEYAPKLQEMQWTLH
jgi:hypothetical protein